RRSGRSAERNREGRRPSRVETFGLVGTMSYQKGPVAFFDGTSAELRKALRPGASIAGYTLSEICSASVKLEADGKTIELGVGSQMRREDDGNWEISATRVDLATAGSSSGSPNAAAATSSSNNGGGEVSEVLKRLMQKREQELK